MDDLSRYTRAQLEAEVTSMMERLTELSLLCESESLLNSLVESMPQAVFSKDTEGRFTFANKQFCRVQELPLEEIVGKTDQDLHPPVLAEKYANDDRWVLANRQVLDMVESHQPIGGSPIYVQVIKAPIKAKSGEVTGVVGMFWDITDQLKAKKELEKLNTNLERLVEERTQALEKRTRDLEALASQLMEIDQLKSAFLATVSHDLRTPMTSVMGFVKVIRKEFVTHFLPLAGNDPDLELKGRRLAENLSIVEEESMRLSRLVNDFLDLSKIESGTSVWRDRDEPVDLMLRKALSAVQHLAEDKPGLIVERDPDSRDATLHVDPDRLVQVLVNLLDNAIKFTDEGYVRIHAAPDDKDMLLIRVMDTGRGVPAGEASKIFDKFHLVNKGDTMLEGLPKGTGLGLSICKEIVEHYGGTIWHEPNEPQGSRICFRIPLAASRD